MKKLLVLLASVLALTSCTASIGSNQSDAKKGENASEDGIVQGTLKENEQLVVYFPNGYDIFSINKSYPGSLYEKVEYTYNRVYSDAIIKVEGGKDSNAKKCYSYYGNASIAIYIYE